ncbi:MAG: heparinase II/III domain-containing protein [Candidatus Helarchaeota archaeon]
MILKVIPRNSDKSIAFEKGGAYFLKNKNFSLMVACFPIGQNGVGGHNHYDVGSFTLSYKGKQIIVDPGSYSYTRYKRDRDKYRSLENHNVVIKSIDKNINYNNEEFWRLGNYYEYELLKFDDTTIRIKIKNIRNNHPIIRNFNIVNDNTIEIIDECNGEFYSLLHFHHDFILKVFRQNNIETNLFNLYHDCIELAIEKYSYSTGYGQFSRSVLFKLRCYNSNRIKFLMKNID